MVSIKSLPAGAGDCFLISIQGKTQTNILIDGGFKQTAIDYLIPELQKLGEAGQILDLVVATHSDIDHIGGLIHFLKSNGKAESPKIIRVNEIWFNGYKHLGNPETIRELTEKEIETLKKVIADNKKHLLLDSKDQLISLEKASSFAKLLSENGYKWNESTLGNAITVENLPEFVLADEVVIRIVSPNEEKLKLLANNWQKEMLMSGLGLKPLPKSDLLEEALEVWEMAIPEYESKVGPIANSIEFETKLRQAQIKQFKEDDSPANGSSIAIVLEAKGKFFLFCGDAHPKIITKGLEAIYGETIPIFDLVKLPHHGAFGCNSKELIEIVQSRNYLISTNGQHESYTHPSEGALAHIIFRETKLPSRLIFNYKDNPVYIELQKNLEFLDSKKISIEGLDIPYLINYE